jgi:hypothetical protein
MDQAHPKARRAVKAKPGGEQLEARSLLTSGAGNIFALVPGTVDKAGDVGAHTFKVESSHFTLPKRTATLGIDVAASGGSAIKPRISSVSSGGRVLPISYPRGGVLRAKASGQTPGLTNGAVLVPVKGSGSYTTHVLGESKTTGNYILGYFVPGDADGNGKVEQADIAAIKKAVGAIVGDGDYSFDADSNRDGRIGQNDVQTARKNLGVVTTITPVISANLDPISDSGTVDRTTVFQDVILTGNGAPGATVSFSEIAKKTPDYTTKIGDDGTYAITVTLAEGSNTFHVTYVDPFGQVISGNIAAITYQKPAVPVVSPTRPEATKPDTSTPEETPEAPSPKYEQMAARYPNWFRNNPDQAAKLREKMSK